MIDHPTDADLTNRHQREAAYWREECEGLAEVLQFIADRDTGNAHIVAQNALANYTAALIDGGEA